MPFYQYALRFRSDYVIVPNYLKFQNCTKLNILEFDKVYRKKY